MNDRSKISNLLLLLLVLVGLPACVGAGIFQSDTKKSGTSSSSRFNGISSIGTISDISAVVNWGHDSQFATYVIFNTTLSADAIIDTVNAPIETYEITGLTPDQTYRFRVRGIDFNGRIDSNINDVSLTTNTYPDVPSEISLNIPSTSPSVNRTPTIVIGGVRSGYTVMLFSDSSCSILVGSRSASGTEIDIITSNLSIGSYRFYARSSGVNLSSCSTASLRYEIIPTAPTGLSLSSPLNSPSDNSAPTITVNRVNSGQSVALFTDSNCYNQVGSEISTGASINITTSSLQSGVYNFYANTSEEGKISSCSSQNISYTIIPKSPIRLALSSISSPISVNQTPTITVSGVSSGQSVELFTDSNCSMLVGMATASGQMVDIITSSLSLGLYIFYANITENGLVSSCSSANVSYSVIPNPPTALSLSSPSSFPSIDQSPIITIDGVKNGQSRCTFYGL